MTVREVIQKLLTEAPNLDAEIYIQGNFDSDYPNDFDIIEITDGGTNDAVFIAIN